MHHCYKQTIEISFNFQIKKATRRDNGKECCNTQLYADARTHTHKHTHTHTGTHTAIHKIYKMGKNTSEKSINKLIEIMGR